MVSSSAIVAVALAATVSATQSYWEPYIAKEVVAVLTGISAVVVFLVNRKPVQPAGPVLSKTEWKKFPLKEKIVISHNTAVYRFALPTADSVLGLPTGQHISVCADVNGKEITRSYTPTSNDDEKGHFDLLIKSYPTGNLSKLFSELKLGDELKVKGPKGFFQYTPNCVKEIGMIAGGTGITPMLQIIKAVLKNPEDKTKLSLIFANVKVDDILLRDELEGLAEKHPEQLRIYHVLNEPPAGWTGGVGFVTKDMIKERCPAPAQDIKILLCGPPPMVKVMSTYAEELGYDKPNAISKMPDMVFKF